jgi:Ca2+-transporting ATPase
MKEGVIIKIRTVETLGSATIICTDKTGTITENKMSLQSVYASTATSFMKIGKMGRPKVIEIAMWAKEPLLLIQWKKLAS